MNIPLRRQLCSFTRLALLAMSVASTWADPFAAQFQLEVGRVGHSFSVQGGQVVSSVVLDPGGLYERVGVLTLSLEPNSAGGGYESYVIHDDSTGDFAWVSAYSGQSGILSGPSLGGGSSI